MIAALFRLCVAVAGLVLAIVSLAGEFGRLDPRLDIVNHFRPLLLAAAAAMLLAGLALPRGRLRTAVLVASLVVVATQARIVVPEHLRPAPARAATAAPVLTIAGYNILYGRADADAIAAWVASEAVDVLVLQEVGDAAATILPRLQASLPHRHFRGGDVAILSRHPLSAPRQGVLRPGDPGLRDLLAADVDLPGIGPTTVVGVHLGWPQPAGVRQPAEIAALLQQFAGLGDRPALLVGDFNATPYSYQFRRLDDGLPLARLTHGLPTFPSPIALHRLPAPPFLPIDHVFASHHFRATTAERGPQMGSDHFPVVVKVGTSVNFEQ